MEVAGRSTSEMGYLLALAVIAGADLAVFKQVVSLVMAEEETYVIWLTVVGLTASSLALAHFAGRILRDRVAGYSAASPKAVWLLIIPWVLLGIVAFGVRMIVATSTDSPDSAVGGVDEWNTRVSGAIMFAVLYAASGAVAGFGEYLTRNPFRVHYRKAVRAYRKSVKRLTRSQPPYERALTVLQVHTRGRQREEQNYQAARSLRLAFADDLKRHAAVLIAAHLQNPSATDGMTLPDRVPFPQPPNTTN